MGKYFVQRLTVGNRGKRTVPKDSASSYKVQKFDGASSSFPSSKTLGFSPPL